MRFADSRLDADSHLDAVAQAIPQRLLSHRWTCSVSSFADGVLREVAKGAQKVFGLETGWHNLDKLYRVRCPR